VKIKSVKMKVVFYCSLLATVFINKVFLQVLLNSYLDICLHTQRKMLLLFSMLLGCVIMKIYFNGL